MGDISTEPGFLQEGDIGFISVPSWWNLESVVLNGYWLLSSSVGMTSRARLPGPLMGTKVLFLSSH